MKLASIFFIASAEYIRGLSQNRVEMTGQRDKHLNHLTIFLELLLIILSYLYYLRNHERQQNYYQRGNTG